MRNRRGAPPPRQLGRPARPQGVARVPIQLPSGPRAAVLMQRILRLVDQSGMQDQWAALHLLNIAFQQSRRSKFPDFDFRRVFELIWMTEKQKLGEQDLLDEAVQAWGVTREVDFETMAAQLVRAGGACRGRDRGGRWTRACRRRPRPRGWESRPLTRLPPVGFPRPRAPLGAE